MKKFRVYIAESAEKDLDAIYRFILHDAGLKQADAIENILSNAIASLANIPLRGRIVPELLDINVSDFRELQVPPWRIFYYIEKDKIGVVAVLDGRRNIAELLKMRLL